ncbi:MAG: acetylxylan esterase [Kiritimatiellales bacterium]
MHIWAADVELSLNRSDGVYRKNEPVVCLVSVKEHGRALKAGKIRLSIVKNGVHELDGEEQPVKNGRAVFDIGRFDEAVWLQFAAILQGTEDKDQIGMVVAPDLFTPGLPEPEDLDDFWAAQKKELCSLSSCAEWTPVEQDRRDVECFDIQISCAGPRPASGYYVRPVGAKKRSLPAVLFLHSAGVSASWNLSSPQTAVSYAVRGNGSICMDLNAHGLPNGQSAEFYQELERGALKNYAGQGLESPEKYYFRFMYLRLLQAVEFLASQPEWNGRMLAIGESQGGGQALAAAALDPRVTDVVVQVPAMCDFSGVFAGRAVGWPKPVSSNTDWASFSTAAYFDNAYLAGRSHANTVIEVGLIDLVCPPPAVYAAYNRLNGKKKIITVPYRSHHSPSGVHRSDWQKGPSRQRERFVDQFLTAQSTL